MGDPKNWVEHLEVDESASPPEPGQELLKAMEGRVVVLEVGCAVGNGILPLLRANSRLFGIACDLSPVAVRFLTEKSEFKCGRCLAFPSDLTKGPGEQPTAEHSAIEDLVP